jgi:hypothetical protein
MASMSDELKERNILKLILIMRFPCAILDVGHPISCVQVVTVYSRGQFIRFTRTAVPRNDGPVTRKGSEHERTEERTRDANGGRRSKI